MNSQYPIGLRQRQRVKRRARILTAAQDLIRATGSVGLSMRSVAERAELSLGTVYNFFGSKGALLYALLHQMVEQLEREMDVSWSTEPLQTLLMVAETAAKHYAADPDLHRVLLRSVLGANEIPGGGLDVAPSVKLYQKPLQAAISAGQLREEADAEIIARDLVISFLGSLILWVRETIGGDELRIQVLYAFSLVLLAVSAETSRAELLKINQRFQRQLSSEFFHLGASVKRARLERARKPDRILAGVQP
jgi:AcrR family transcriptional regulator